jgi:hypothetical protein
MPCIKEIVSLPLIIIIIIINFLPYNIRVMLRGFSLPQRIRRDLRTLDYPKRAHISSEEL